MTKFEIKISSEAKESLLSLKNNKSKKRIYNAVSKSIKLMSEDLKHPSLNTHVFYSLKGINNEKVFESYAQNNTPGAYRIFWHYGPNLREITIIAITPHP